MAFLDYEGLQIYTDKLEKRMGNGASFTVGDGITIKDNAISVTTPVKGVTQAEYSALSETEKNTGLYVITDANINLNDRGEVYSTEETRIGTWIDGEPLYMRVFEGSVVTDGDVFSLDENVKVVFLDGHLITSFGNVMMLPYYGSASDYIYPWINNKNHAIATAACSLYSGLPITICIKYTKTTDAAPTEQVTLLTSQVEPPKKVTLSSSTVSSASPITATLPNTVSVASATASSANFKL